MKENEKILLCGGLLTLIESFSPLYVHKHYFLKIVLDKVFELMLYPNDYMKKIIVIMFLLFVGLSKAYC